MSKIPTKLSTVKYCSERKSILDLIDWLETMIKQVNLKTVD